MDPTKNKCNSSAAERVLRSSQQSQQREICTEECGSMGSSSSGSQQVGRGSWLALTTDPSNWLVLVLVVGVQPAGGIIVWALVQVSEWVMLGK